MRFVFLKSASETVTPPPPPPAPILLQEVQGYGYYKHCLFPTMVLTTLLVLCLPVFIKHNFTPQRG